MQSMFLTLPEVGVAIRYSPKTLRNHLCVETGAVQLPGAIPLPTVLVGARRLVARDVFDRWLKATAKVSWQAEVSQLADAAGRPARSGAGQGLQQQEGRANG